MPPDYIKNHALCNTAFAAELATAVLFGQKSFEFKKHKFKVADHIGMVKRDIAEGFYKLSARRK